MKLRYLKILFFSIFFILVGAIFMELNRDFIKSAIFLSKSVLKNSPKEQLPPSDFSIKKIQSVNYPLILKKFDFKNTALLSGAGSIGELCGELSILDRSGTFFALKKGKLSKFFSIENNFSDFVLKYQSDDMDMLRAHSYTANNNNLFISYTRFNDDESFSHVISNYSLACDDAIKLKDEKILWERELSEVQATNTQAAGGALLLDENYLYSSFGYVSSSDWADPKKYEEAKKSKTGIVLRIDLESLNVEIFTSGHRNITALLKRNGEIFSIEHAIKGGDEINKLEFGSDYGFPYSTYGTNYSSFLKPLITKSHDKNIKFKDPIWAFVPSIAPGDGIYLNNSSFPRWDDSIIIGGLKSRSIFIGKYEKRKLVYIEPIFIGDRIRSLKYFDNKIFMLTDTAKVLSLEFDIESWNKDIANSGRLAMSPYLEKCVQCHSLKPTSEESAPHLFGIMQRPIASIDYKYSNNFSSLKGQYWDKELLLKYIKNPQSLVEGSSMPSIGLNAIEAENVYIELLKLK